ncbi:Snf7-domain-containing protein [Scheffersomyces coipomensis]|uniref:Snf7-domain-containing protein n=1 Tax=Scheffersomyces coipomensis TaxID=1788519 RepID=UPI00315DB274
MGQQTSAPPKITAQDKAIFQLKQQRDKLKQYQKKISIIIDKQSNLAKVAIQHKQLDRAKFYLRAKKQQESIISKTYNQLDNLEGLIGTIEFKLIEKDVLYGLQQGNDVLKKLNNELSIDKIDKVLDDLQDERVKVDEISDALGMGSGLTNQEELEVDEEFERLELEVNGDKIIPETKVDEPKVELPQVPDNKIMPEAPTNELEAPEEEQEEQVTSKPNEPIAI